MNAARTEAGQGYPVARFKQAQKEFIQVTGVADFDPKAKTRAGELREERPRKSPRTRRACARPSARALRPVRNFVRQAELERARKGQGSREGRRA